MINEILNKENEEFKEPKKDEDASKSNLELIKDLNLSYKNKSKIVNK